jgi:F-type H+-transporting ATPase subunit b
MIDLDLTLILVEAVIFLLTLVILNKILVQPIVSHLDARNKSIKDGLSNVNQNSQEIGDLEVQAGNIIRAAKKEAHDLREEKLTLAKQSVQQKIDSKKGEIEVELKKFNEELEAKRMNLKNSLLGQGPLFKESLKVKLIATSAN